MAEVGHNQEVTTEVDEEAVAVTEEVAVEGEVGEARKLQDRSERSDGLLKHFTRISRRSPKQDQRNRMAVTIHPEQRDDSAHARYRQS